MIKQLPVEFEFDFSCSRPQPNYNIIKTFDWFTNEKYPHKFPESSINRCTICFDTWQNGMFAHFQFYNTFRRVYDLICYDRSFGLYYEMAIMNDVRGRTAENMAYSLFLKLINSEKPSNRFESDVIIWNELRAVFKEFVNKEV